MAKNSGNTSHEASLKQRQLNGINKITNPRRDAPKQAGSSNRAQRTYATGQDVKGKSLLDRMTSPPATTTSVGGARDEHNASPRKRKPQKNKQRDGDQVEEEIKDPPAKRQKPADTAAQATAHQETARKPLPWHNIKTKQQRTPAAEPSQQSTQEPAVGKQDPQASSSTKGAESYPSPPSAQPRPALDKRSVDDLGASKQACKKPHTTITMEPVDAATAKERQPCLKQSAPAVANPDCEHTYKAYGNDSIPLLFSIYARDGRQDVLLNDPSLDLQCRAIALLESPKGFAANDLGRLNVAKTGKSKIINDVDLYLMEDQKVYVGTERGLLLVADYLKLAGVPDSSPVRFNGIKPAYVKASPPMRFSLWVATTTWDISVREAERAKMMPGELPLLYGEMVEVWAIDPTCDPNNGPRYAFGKLVHDGQTGWFDLNNTVARRKDIPEMVPPDEPVFTEKNYAFSRNDPPAPAAQLASLSSVKSYVSPRNAPPPAPIPTPSPAATAATVAPHTPLSSTKSCKISTPNSLTPPKSTSRISKNAVKGTRPVAKAPSSPKNDEVKSLEAAACEAEEIKNNVQKQDDATAQEVAKPVPETSKDTTSQEAEGKKQDVEKEKSATSSNKGPARLNMQEHCAEDDVDWGDDEL